MKLEAKARMSSQILSFINRYIKEGSFVQKTWSFLAKSDLEKMLSEAYEQGRRDQREEGKLDVAIEQASR